MRGIVVSITVSPTKGTRKTPVEGATLEANHGITGDAHASSTWHRQVSLLAIESINKMRDLGLEVGPGDFAENITTKGIDLLSLPIGTRLRIGDAEVEVSQIGKRCHSRCNIYYQAGDCVMPREGIFVKVLKGGEIKVGDPIEVLNYAITFAVITMSDRGASGLREDKSGRLLKEYLEERGYQCLDYRILPDEWGPLREALLELSERVDLVVTNGGTGLSPRDITPDVTLEVIEREVPGIAEALRAEGMKKTPRAMLSRGVAGIKGRCLIVNLPGSPKAVQESLDVLVEVLPHAIEKIKGSEKECAR